MNVVLNINVKRELSILVLTLVLIPSILVLIIPYAQAATAPNPPTGLSAMAISPTTVSLFWSPPQYSVGSHITGYLIEYKIVPNTIFSTLTTAGNVTKYNATGLVTGKTYIFRVSTVNSTGSTGSVTCPSGQTVPSSQSCPTAEVSVTPTNNSKPPQNIPPNPPTGLVVTSNSLTQINLSWNPPTINAGPSLTGYRIQFSIDSGSFTDLVSNSGNHG